MIKAALFDMDGVLIDSEPEYWKVEKKLGEEAGFDYTEEEKKKYVGNGMFYTWTELKKKHGFKKDVSEIIKEETVLMRSYYEKGSLVPFEDMTGLLKEFSYAGVMTAVATSSAETIARMVIKRLGIGKYVNALVTGDMVEKTKPEPDIFLLAAKLLGAAPEECVVIEDSRNGIAAAKTAGMRAVGFKPEQNSQDISAADYIITPRTGGARKIFFELTNRYGS